MKKKFNNAVGPQIRDRQGGKSALIPTLVFLLFLGGISAATQFFAHTFAYHSTLGTHFNFLYPPWRIFQWLNDWYTYYPQQFTQAGSAGTVIMALGLMAVMAVQKMQAQKAALIPYVHGSARWAEREDIEAAGLLPRKRTLLSRLKGTKTQALAGLYIGGWKDKKGRIYYLVYEGPGHVLYVGPTRSGKGVTGVLLTLLSWPYSVVITDSKGELAHLTAGSRKKHGNNKILYFEPAALHGSVHWNPLDQIRLRTEHEVADVQNLATLIVDPDGKGLETHWQKTAQSLFVGLILYALYALYKATTKIPSLADIDDLLSDPNHDIRDLWVEMHQVEFSAGANYRLISASGKDMLERPEDEAGSVLSTVKSYLSLYRDPVVRENTNDSHFSVTDLMNHDVPVSLYIITKPADKTRLRPLIRILINMILRLLTSDMKFSKGRATGLYRYRLLLMLDEFPSLGNLQILHESIAYLAGYGIQCYLICQDINQLKSKTTGYGPDESISSNCHVQGAFTPVRLETAEYFSKLIGQTTITTTQVSETANKTTRTTQELRRSLLTPDELLRLPGPIKAQRDGEDVIVEPGDMIVLVAGFPAIYGVQTLYFLDPYFQERAEISPPVQSDRLT